MGGGGYVAGPVGLAAASLRLPLVLTEADSHLGVDEPAARAARAPRLPRVPDRGPRRRALPRHRPADPRRRRPSAGRRAVASGSPRRTPACSCSAARSARARSTRPPSRRSRARPSGSCTSPAGATTRSSPAAHPGPGYELLEYLDLEDFGRAMAAADLGGRARRRVGVRARGIRAARRPDPVPARRRRPPELECPLDGRGRRGRRDPRRRAERRRGSAPRSRRCSSDERGARGDGRGGALRSPARAPPREIAAELLEAAAVSTPAGERPWAGRRMHLVGLGGAGMSAYARAAHALGAEVSGSDAAESEYTARAGRRRDRAAQRSATTRRTSPRAGASSCTTPRPCPDENAERAAARERGLAERPRAALLASSRRCGVRSRSRAPTARRRRPRCSCTSCARPGWSRAGSWARRSAAGSRTRAGATGEWLVVEADESDRSMLSLDVEIAVLTNVELDHHATFSSLERAARGLPRAPGGRAAGGRSGTGPSCSRSSDAEPVAYAPAELELTTGGSRFRWQGEQVELAVPGRAQRDRTPPARSRRRGWRGLRRAAALAALAAFGGAGRRFQRLGTSAAGAVVVRGLRPPSDGGRRRRCGRRGRSSTGRLVAVFQPHLYSRTALLAREFGRALAEADVAVVLDVYPARERAEDFPGVSGLHDRRGGRRRGRRAGLSTGCPGSRRRRRRSPRCWPRATSAW